MSEKSLEKVNLAEKLAQFTERWSPRVVGELNGQQVKLVKLEGEFVRHHHEREDELFLVLRGHWLRGRVQRIMRAAMIFYSSLLLPGLAAAGPADVLSASARCSAESVCRFSVRAKHADEGWNHYVDRWQILAPDGTVLATRILRHPHVDEQPFTRSLTGVKIPKTLDSVRVRAGDSKHGFGGQEIRVELQRPSLAQ